MKIVIVYELPQRELENDLLLKEYFENKGHQCQLIKFPFNNVCSLRKKYKNKTDLILVHSLYDEKVLNHLVYSIFGKVPYVINLQVEQIGTNKSERDSNQYGHLKDMVRMAYHICWGTKSFEKLKNNGVKESHLLLTGPIQMDFLRSSFSNYFYSRKELLTKYNICENKKVCLFISSFSYVGLPEFARKDLKQKIGVERFNKFETLSIQTQNAILEWFDKFLSCNPDYIIIYRKHPAEVVSSKLTILAERYNNNFYMISDYSVKQWILVADYILTWYSTSTAEAYFANKKILILRPLPIDYDTEVVILNGCDSVVTYEKFVKALQNESFNSLKNSVINQYFDYNGVKPSFLRIGEKVERIYNDKQERFPWEKVNTKEFDSYNCKENIKRYIYYFYKTLIGILRKVEDLTGFKFDGGIAARIRNQRNEILRISEQKSEINRILSREDYLKDVVSSYLLKDNSNVRNN